LRRPLLKSSAFVRAARRIAKINPRIVDDLRDALELLEADAYHPRLRTHKLKGEHDGTWSCSVGRDLRIVFEFVSTVDGEAVLLHSVGTHDEVY